MLNNFSMRALVLKKWDTAARANQEAVDIRRGLARSDPVAFGPDLALSLRGYALIRSILKWQLPQALSAIRESTAILWQLAAEFPGGSREDLRRTLDSAAGILVSLDRPEEAASVRDFIQAGELDKAAEILSETKDPFT